MYKIFIVLFLSLMASYYSIGIVDNQEKNHTSLRKSLDNYTHLEVEAHHKFLLAVSSKGKNEDIDNAELSYKKLLDTGINSFNYQLRLSSLKALRAKHYFWPNQKMEAVNESIGMFNNLLKVIRKDKDQIKAYEFYFYRGVTYSEFPSFLNKRQLAKSDLQKAYNLLSTIDVRNDEKISLSYHLAMVYYRDKDYLKAKSIAENIIKDFPSEQHFAIAEYLDLTNDLLKNINKDLKT